MKKIVMLLLVLAIAAPAWSQQKKAKTNSESKTTAVEETKKVYDEGIDPMPQIDEALEEARSSGRLVMCQVGGNWCPWCLRFAQFIENDQEIASVVKDNFVYIHVNTSKENRNEEMLRRLGNPGRFGYPVLVLLDEEGRVLHIQNSSYLEEGKSYNRKKVLEFFLNWTRKAMEEMK